VKLDLGGVPKSEARDGLIQSFDKVINAPLKNRHARENEKLLVWVVYGSGFINVQNVHTK